MPVLWDHLEAAELVLGDEPIAGLTLMGSMLVSLGVRNRLILHLCGLLVKLLRAVGLSPMHCSFNLFIFKHRYVSNSPQGIQ